MITDEKFLITVSVLAAVLACAACSSAPETKTTPETKTAAEAPKPPEPVTAKTAFYAMYKPARTWATDLLPLSLASNETPDLNNGEGKAAMWTAVFVSPSLRAARTFSYSAVDSGAIRKGVSVGGVESWSGATAHSRPFQTTEFIINSDAAYQTALAKADAWVKKHPGKKPAFYLECSAKYPQPDWLVLWGTTKSGFAVHVNATTGIAEK